MDIALHTADWVFEKGSYMARRVLAWEIGWMKNREIPEGKRGCFAKTRSWLDDEDVKNLCVND